MGSSRFRSRLGPTDGRVTVMRSGDLIAGAAVIVDVASAN